jgi:hypothetical protein
MSRVLPNAILAKCESRTCLYSFQPQTMIGSHFARVFLSRCRNMRVHTIFTLDSNLPDFPLAGHGYTNLNQAGTGQAIPEPTAVSGAASSNRSGLESVEVPHEALD